MPAAAGHGRWSSSAAGRGSAPPLHSRRMHLHLLAHGTAHTTPHNSTAVNAAQKDGHTRAPPRPPSSPARRQKTPRRRSPPPRPPLTAISEPKLDKNRQKSGSSAARASVLASCLGSRQLAASQSNAGAVIPTAAMRRNNPQQRLSPQRLPACRRRRRARQTNTAASPHPHPAAPDIPSR